MINVGGCFMSGLEVIEGVQKPSPNGRRKIRKARSVSLRKLPLNFNISFKFFY